MTYRMAQLLTWTLCLCVVTQALYTEKFTFMGHTGPVNDTQSHKTLDIEAGGHVMGFCPRSCAEDVRCVGFGVCGDVESTSCNIYYRPPVLTDENEAHCRYFEQVKDILISNEHTNTTDSASSVVVTDSASSVVVTDSASSVVVTDSASSVVVTDSASSVVVTDSASSVVVTDSASSVVVTDGVAPSIDAGAEALNSTVLTHGMTPSVGVGTEQVTTSVDMGTYGVTPSIDCADCACVAGYSDVTGLYPITLGGENLTVKCVFQDGAAHTVIFHRNGGSVNFDRTYNEYENGFGSPSSEIWLGNKFLHQLTEAGNSVLRIELQYASLFLSRYVEYGHFTVGNATEDYVLSIAGYSGTTVDRLSGSDGVPFSAKDRDNDPSACGCAGRLSGGWWYHCCSESRLTLPLTGYNASVSFGWDLDLDLLQSSLFDFTMNQPALTSAKMMLSKP